MADPNEPKPITSDVAGQTEKRSDERKDELLDDALDDSFPASDPPSITQPKHKVGRSEPASEHVAPAPQINPAPVDDNDLRRGEGKTREGV